MAVSPQVTAVPGAVTALDVAVPAPPAIEYAPVPAAPVPVPPAPRPPEPLPLGSATDANHLATPGETLTKAGEVVENLAKGDLVALQRGPLLIHGNYCGIGNKLGLPPVDVLDAACMRHDACTTEIVPSCDCNQRFQREATAIAADPSRTNELRALAGATAASMAVLVCR